ncbi:MAG: hypothetical protein ACREH5_00055 [Candidatus Omnitrophota bacterium]
MRALSAGLVISFLAQDLVWALPEITHAVPFARPTLSAQIPASVAVIEDTWRAKGSDPSGTKTLILVQDAHTNESAQQNIAKTIEILLGQEREGLRYIFLEAGAGDDSLSFLRQYATPEIRQRVANSYLKKGWIQGPDYLDLTSGHDLKLWGVEDKELYRKSVECYRALAERRGHVNATLDKIARAIKTLKPRIYDPSLLSFDTAREAFMMNGLSFTEYLGLLSEEARKLNVSLAGFPHLLSLEALKEKESAIDFQKANEEQLRAVASLSVEERKTIDEAPVEHRAPFKLDSQEHKQEKGFYVLLEEALTYRHFESAGGGREISKRGSLGRRGDLEMTKNYPELSKYFSYLKAAQKLDLQKLLKEKESLELLVTSALVRDHDEMKLIEVSRAFEVLRKLLNLTATSDEVDAIERDPKKFDVIELSGFLNKKIMDLEQYYEDALFLDTRYEEAFVKAREFYRLTKERDYAFLRNALRKMSGENEGKAVLVVGGYHAEHLKALLKQNNVSYVSIIPQVLRETNQKKYESILLGQTSSRAGETGAHIGVEPGRELALVVEGARFSVAEGLREEFEAPAGAPARPAGGRLAAKGQPEPTSKEKFFLEVVDLLNRVYQTKRYDRKEFVELLAKGRNIHADLWSSLSGVVMVLEGRTPIRNGKTFSENIDLHLSRFRLRAAPQGYLIQFDDKKAPNPFFVVGTVPSGRPVRPAGARLAAKPSVVREDLEKIRSERNTFLRGGKILHQSDWSQVRYLPQTAAPLVIKYLLREHASDAKLATWLFEHQVDAAKAIHSLGREKEDGFYGPSNLLVGFEYLPKDPHQRGLIMPKLEGEDAHKRFLSGPEYQEASAPPHNKHFESVMHYLETARAMAEATVLFNGLGWVHGDLKPQNFFVEGPRAGREQNIVLYDFDISRRVGESAAKDKDGGVVLMGTPGFMSSHQSGGFPARLTDDVHGLSATLAFLWSGELLYDPEGRTNVDGRLIQEQNVNSAKIWDKFEKKLEGNPLKNIILSGLNEPNMKPYASVSEMVKDIQAVIGSSGSRLADGVSEELIDEGLNGLFVDFYKLVKAAQKAAGGQRQWNEVIDFCEAVIAGDPELAEYGSGPAKLYLGTVDALARLIWLAEGGRALDPKAQAAAFKKIRHDLITDARLFYWVKWRVGEQRNATETRLIAKYLLYDQGSGRKYFNFTRKQRTDARGLVGRLPEEHPVRRANDDKVPLWKEPRIREVRNAQKEIESLNHLMVLAQAADSLAGKRGPEGTRHTWAYVAGRYLDEKFPEEMKALVTPALITRTLAHDDVEAALTTWRFLTDKWTRLPKTLKRALAIDRLEAVLKNGEDQIIWAAWKFLIRNWDRGIPKAFQEAGVRHFTNAQTGQGTGVDMRFLAWLFLEEHWLGMPKDFKEVLTKSPERLTEALLGPDEGIARGAFKFFTKYWAILPEDLQHEGFSAALLSRNENMLAWAWSLIANPGTHLPEKFVRRVGGATLKEMIEKKNFGALRAVARTGALGKVHPGLQGMPPLKAQARLILHTVKSGGVPLNKTRLDGLNYFLAPIDVQVTKSVGNDKARYLLLFLQENSDELGFPESEQRSLDDLIQDTERGAETNVIFHPKARRGPRRGTGAGARLAALRVLSELVTKPQNFNWEDAAKAGLLPVFVGMRIGPSSKRGNFSLVLNENYYYQWHALGFREDGWIGTVVEAGAKNDLYKFTLEFEKPGREKFRKTYQIGRYTRTLKPFLRKEGKPLLVLDILQRPGVKALSELVTKPANYDWTAAARDGLLPNVEGLRLGPLDRRGQLPFRPLKGVDYFYFWFALGFQEAGWEATIVDGNAKGTIYELVVEFSKEGRQPLRRVFQIGRYHAKTFIQKESQQSAGKEKGILAIDHHLGHRALGELVTKPANYDWEAGLRRGELPELKGHRFGPFYKGGDIAFYPEEMYRYDWSPLGLEEDGWEGQCVGWRMRKNFYEFTLEFRKKDRKPFQKTFQIGRLTRSIPGQHSEKGKTLEVLEISDRLGLGLVSRLVQYPGDFDWQKAWEAGELPDLTELRLGTTDPNGQISFNPVTNHRYPWPVLGRMESGRDAVVTACGVEDGYYRFIVKLTKEGKEPVFRIFQIGPHTRILPGAKQEKPFLVNALNIISQETLAKLAFKDEAPRAVWDQRAQAQVVVSTAAAPEKIAGYRELFRRYHETVANLGQREREIAIDIAGESPWLENYDKKEVAEVRRKLQEGLAEFRPEGARLAATILDRPRLLAEARRAVAGQKEWERVVEAAEKMTAEREILPKQTGQGVELDLKAIWAYAVLIWLAERNYELSSEMRDRELGLTVSSLKKDILLYQWTRRHLQGAFSAKEAKLVTLFTLLRHTERKKWYIQPDHSQSASVQSFINGLPQTHPVRAAYHFGSQDWGNDEVKEVLERDAGYERFLMMQVSANRVSDLKSQYPSTVIKAWQELKGEWKDFSKEEKALVAEAAARSVQKIVKQRNFDALKAIAGSGAAGFVYPQWSEYLPVQVQVMLALEMQRPRPDHQPDETVKSALRWFFEKISLEGLESKVADKKTAVDLLQVFLSNANEMALSGRERAQLKALIQASRKSVVRGKNAPPGARLSAFFIGVARAHPAPALDGARLALEIQEEHSSIFELSYKASRFRAVSRTGLVVELSQSQIKNGKPTRRLEDHLRPSDLRRMTEAVNDGSAHSLKEVTVSHKRPVIVEINLDVIDNASFGFYLDYLIAEIQYARKRFYGKNVFFKLTGSKPFLVELAKKKAPGLFVGEGELRGLKDTARVRLAPATRGVSRGVINMPVAAFKAGDIAAFRAILQLSIYAGRIDLKKIPDGFAGAYSTLAGEKLSTADLSDILQGLADLEKTLRFALKPVVKVAIDRAVQFFRLIKRMTEQAA